MYGKRQLGVVQGRPGHPLQGQARPHGGHPLRTAGSPKEDDSAEGVADLEAGPRARAHGL